MASLVALIPLEIIEHIIDIVATNDRYEAPQYSYPNTKACALVCHSFLPRCRRHIFHSIKLYEGPTQLRRKRPLASSFARLIIDNPGVADHVRKLHFMICQYRKLVQDQQVGDALERLKGLETLVFQPDGVAVDWVQLKTLPSWSPILPLLHSPSILSLKLIDVHGFRLSDLIPCTNLREFNLMRVHITEEELTSMVGLPFEPIRIRHLDIRYTKVDNIERMVQQRGPDGRHILDLGGLISIAAFIDTLEDRASALNIITRVRGLETLRVLVGRSLDPTNTILPLVSPSLETLSNLSLTLNITEGNPDPLCGICGLFQTISGRNCIQILDIFIRIPKHLFCSTGDEWGTLEKVLLGPGWSSLIQLDLRIIANGARENMWLEKALRELPQTQLRGLSSSNTLKFNFSADEGLPG